MDALSNVEDYGSVLQWQLLSNGFGLIGSKMKAIQHIAETQQISFCLDCPAFSALSLALCIYLPRRNGEHGQEDSQGDCPGLMGIVL